MTRPLMIFAAGFGTRMRPLTEERPKPLIKVGGIALIDHAMELGQISKSGPIVVNAHYKAQMIHDHFEGVNVTVLTEEPVILDTGGGLRNALPKLGAGPLATLNSDPVWEDPSALAQLWEHWDPDQMDCLLCVIPKQLVYGHPGPGDFDLGDHGRLRFRTQETASYVYSGLQIIKPETLSLISEPVFSLRDVWKKLEKTDRLLGYVHASSWCEVGHPDAIQEAEALLDARRDV